MSYSQLLDTPLECKNSCFRVQHEQAEIFINGRMSDQRVFNVMNLEMDRTLGTVISCSGRGLASYCVWIGQEQVIWGSIKGRSTGSAVDQVKLKLTTALKIISCHLTEFFRSRNGILLTLFWFVVGEMFITALLLLCHGRIFPPAIRSILLWTMKPRCVNNFDLYWCNKSPKQQQGLCRMSEVCCFLRVRLYTRREGSQGLQGISELVQNRDHTSSRLAKC